MGSPPHPLLVTGSGEVGIAGQSFKGPISVQSLLVVLQAPSGVYCIQSNVGVGGGFVWVSVKLHSFLVVLQPQIGVGV